MITDVSLEEDVIGGMINDKNYVYKIQKYITEDYFTDPIKQKLCNFILEQVNEGVEYNVISLKSSLDLNAFDLMQWSSKCIISSVRNAVILSDICKKRRLLLIASRVTRECQDKESDVYEMLDRLQGEVTDLYSNSQSSIKTMEEACSELRTIVNKNLAGGRELSGSAYNLKELNRATGGLHEGELTVVAGESQMGKTALGVNIMSSVALNGDAVAIFSMEMRSSLLASRIVASVSGVSGSKMLRTPLDTPTLQRFEKGVGKVMNLPIYIDESSANTATEISNTVRTMVQKYGIKGFVVDYLQMLKMGAGKEQDIADAVRIFKNTCTSLGVWCLLLSQLNRDKENPTPTMTRLRGSGQIEEGADNIIFVYRPEKYKTLNLTFPNEFSSINIENKAWIHLAKQRNGAQVDFICDWDGATTTFSDLDNSVLSNIEEANNNINIYEDCPF